MKKINILILVCFLTLSLSSFAHSEGKSEFKKIIAIGDVDTGYVGFNGMDPEKLSGLFKVRIKKRLEDSGKYVVVIVNDSTKKSKAPNDDPMAGMTEPKQNMSPAELAKYMQQIQNGMMKMRKEMMGAYNPVAAQAAFGFVLNQSKSWQDSGGAIGFAQQFTDVPLDAGDFSSETLKVTLVTIEQNPETWATIDEHAERASSTKFKRVAGTDYYQASGSADHERTFNRMFKKAIDKSVKWMNSKLDSKPWEGQIVKVDGSKFYINAGSNAGIKNGMKFTAYTRKPVQGGGLDLGDEDVMTGSIKVIKTNDKFSIAKLSSGKAKKDSILKSK